MNERPSAGGIIVNSEGKILLVHQHSNSWSFPKGGIEKNESEFDAAKREILEETGLTDLTLIKNLGSYTRYSFNKDGTGEATEFGERKRTLFLFTTISKESDLKPQDGEITDAKYFSIDDALQTLTHPKDSAFLTSVRAQVEAALL